MEEFQCCNLSVPKISKIAGGILTAWGVVAYLLTMTSITAMIPAFMGAPILLMGFLAEKNPEKRKLFMHISVTFGLLAALGGLRILTMLSGPYDLAFASHAVLLLVGGVYTFICVKSFIWIRKQQDAE
ncbi:MAG: hypothetical protein MK235_00600 [Candidatus Poseidoniales archaeon]|nr:hypothetical protein [Candidatus Poseidoniales archaeon]MCH2358005.1 hypothetical protein [Candidatus Poseidoniales archaeon]